MRRWPSILLLAGLAVALAIPGQDLPARDYRAAPDEAPSGGGSEQGLMDPHAGASSAPSPRLAAVSAEPAGSAQIVPSGSDLEVLGPHDLLEIAVFDVEQFSRTVRVSDDGAITLPFIGRIEVGGMTRVGLEQKIAALLGEKWVQDPQVSVFVKEYNSRKISVSGAVKNPSTFELLGRKTLLDVVSEAGGFTQDVGRTCYVIRRQPGGGTDRITIDLERLIYGSESGLNVAIQPGDVIYAPIEEKITVYIHGAVKSPGGYEFRHGDQITVLRAITKAGGLTERAAEKRVQILRLNPEGNQITIQVDLRKVRDGKLADPILQREDVVDVPEAFF